MRQQKPWQLVDESAPLHLVVTKHLEAQGHAHAKAWAKSLPPEGKRGSFEQQRACVNRVLRTVIGQAPENTTDVREAITDTGTREDWLRLFMKEVAPWMVKKDQGP